MILLAPVPLKLWHYQCVHPPCLLEVMALSAMSGIWVTWPIEKISALTQVSSASPHIAHSTSPHMDNVIHAMWCGMSNTKQSRRNPRESWDFFFNWLSLEFVLLRAPRYFRVLLRVERVQIESHGNFVPQCFYNFWLHQIVWLNTILWQLQSSNQYPTVSLA